MSWSGIEMEWKERGGNWEEEEEERGKRKEKEYQIAFPLLEFT